MEFYLISNEIWALIFANLNYHNLCQISLCCKHFYSLTKYSRDRKIAKRKWGKLLHDLLSLNTMPRANYFRWYQSNFAREISPQLVHKLNNQYGGFHLPDQQFNIYEYDNLNINNLNLDIFPGNTFLKNKDLCAGKQIAFLYGDAFLIEERIDLMDSKQLNKTHQEIIKKSIPIRPKYHYWVGKKYFYVQINF
jgi:hypothetical protein